ncbi:MAG: BlaI/MecI/CopY family transcriptional regulator [Vampirovibrio sp.]|jgi:predicted transcriptional regulator|nr:BlaI/MecI/CopY family transcriptional regulator [Vampirovibrio sp.]
MMMAMRSMDLKQGDLENLILNALWDLEQEGNTKVFVGDVQDRIKTEKRMWAYTTVKTVMDRLVDKTLASRSKEGKKYFYASLTSRDNASYTALKKLVQQYFKGDLDGLAVATAKLRKEGFGMKQASVASREQLERVFQSPAVEAAMMFNETSALVGNS